MAETYPKWPKLNETGQNGGRNGVNDPNWAVQKDTNCPKNGRNDQKWPNLNETDQNGGWNGANDPKWAIQNDTKIPN